MGIFNNKNKSEDTLESVRDDIFTLVSKGYLNYMKIDSYSTEQLISLVKGLHEKINYYSDLSEEYEQLYKGSRQGYLELYNASSEREDLIEKLSSELEDAKGEIESLKRVNESLWDCHNRSNEKPVYTYTRSS